MQYEVRYKFNGVEDTYYVNVMFASCHLQKEDIEYSIHQYLVKHLGSSKFEIISYCQV